MDREFDCVIFGAGVAGTSAAYRLASLGRRVVVLAGDRAGSPTGSPTQPPICTGGVSPAVAKLLDFDLTPAIDCVVRDVRYAWKDDAPVSMQLDAAQAMWMVRRDRFDALLRDKAIAAGATFEPVTAKGARLVEVEGDRRWCVKTPAGELTAAFAIVADGARSTALRWVGLPRPTVRSAVSLELAAPPDEVPRVDFVLGEIDRGFLWCFPKQGAVSLGAATFIGEGDPELADRLVAYAARRGWQAEKANVRQRPIALWSGDRVLNAERALVAGDAAGLSDPVTAEGMRAAFDSGLQAGAAIGAALDGQTGALRGYTRQIQQTWGTDYAWASRLAQALYRFPGAAYKLATQKRKASQLMSKVLCGELRYSEVVELGIAKLMKKLLPWE